MVGPSKIYVPGSVAVLCVGHGEQEIVFNNSSDQSRSYSLLPAITTDGIIFSHIKLGGYNGEQFLLWLEGLLKVMNPYPAKHSILVLDNCRIHHVDGVEEMCTEAYFFLLLVLTYLNDFCSGVKLVFLPPYSPDLNPIEECFSYIKSYISRHGATFRHIVEVGDEADPFMFLYSALDTVTADAAKGWFGHSGY